MTRGDDSKITGIAHPFCCGLDVHKESISVCVIFPGDNGASNTRSPMSRYAAHSRMT